MTLLIILNEMSIVDDELAVFLREFPPDGPFCPEYRTAKPLQWEQKTKGDGIMYEVIDLCPYLPEENTHIRPTAVEKEAPSLLMALEAVVTAVIGISIVIGVGAFLLML